MPARRPERVRALEVTLMASMRSEMMCSTTNAMVAGGSPVIAKNFSGVDTDGRRRVVASLPSRLAIKSSRYGSVPICQICVERMTGERVKAEGSWGRRCEIVIQSLRLYFKSTKVIALIAKFAVAGDTVKRLDAMGLEVYSRRMRRVDDIGDCAGVVRRSDDKAFECIRKIDTTPFGTGGRRRGFPNELIRLVNWAHRVGSKKLLTRAHHPKGNLGASSTRFVTVITETGNLKSH
ncbi:hypothetical protein FPV67DRAFT_1456969 [Lyophyllum atratum]|nr:hypothetical protein FPV67DRAFT_1456969 [Lyophyllum atratum]